MRERAVLPFCREKDARLSADGHHVTLQFHHHAAVIAQVMPSRGRERHLHRKAGIQPDPAVIIGQHAGIERELFPAFFTPDLSVFVVHFSVERILPGRCVAHSDANLAEEIKRIVEIIPAVGSLRDIRRIQGPDAEGIARVLPFPVNDAFTAPVREIGNRGRPADIVIDTEDRRAECVMTAVDIDPVAEYMRLTVGNIFPAWKVRIESLIFHSGDAPLCGTASVLIRL